MWWKKASTAGNHNQNDKGPFRILPYPQYRNEGRLYKHVLTHQHFLPGSCPVPAARLSGQKVAAAGARFYSPAEIALLPNLPGLPF